ncbi:MAG: MauE/DoxX family redox-associated membrane protein [Opitutales bacterium]
MGRMVGVNTKALLHLLARLVVAGVFISAGLPKVQDPIAFAASIDGFRIVSGSLSLWTAVVLPWLEIIIGIGLLTPWLRRASASLIALLLALFIILHASAWIRGLDINCGCFGESAESPAYLWLILRNLALLLATLFVLSDALRNKKP